MQLLIDATRLIHDYQLASLAFVRHLNNPAMALYAINLLSIPPAMFKERRLKAQRLFDG